MKNWFHIGYPKAGSTTLQKQFFNLHSEINFLGVYPSNNIGIDTTTVDHNHPFFQFPELEELHKSLGNDDMFEATLQKSKLEKIIEKTHNKGEVNLLSNERITSVFFAFPDIDEKLYRIKQLGFEGVIIICRNQFQILKSQYRDHPFDPKDLVHGKPMSIDEWVMKSNEIEYGYLNSLKYDVIANKCSALFGENNVTMIALEQILNDPLETAKFINKKLKIDTNECISLLDNLPNENRGVSKRYNQMMAWKKKLTGEFPISNFIPDSLLRLGKSYLKQGPKAKYDLKPSTNDFLIDFFSNSNRNLGEKWNIDVIKYNYPLMN